MYLTFYVLYDFTIVHLILNIALYFEFIYISA
jgi:hypothetical protein